MKQEVEERTLLEALKNIIEEFHVTVEKAMEDIMNIEYLKDNGIAIVPKSGYNPIFDHL